MSDRRSFLRSMLGLPLLAKLGVGPSAQGQGGVAMAARARFAEAIAMPLREAVMPRGSGIFYAEKAIGFSGGECLHYAEGPDSFASCTPAAHDGFRQPDLGMIEVYENIETAPDTPPAPVLGCGESPSEVLVLISDINGTRCVASRSGQDGRRRPLPCSICGRAILSTGTADRSGRPCHIGCYHDQESSHPYL